MLMNKHGGKLMRNHLRGWIALGLAGLIAWPVVTLAGGREEARDDTSLVIGVTGLGVKGTITTTIDGLDKGQTLSIGVKPPEGGRQADVITLSPGRNRVDFPRAVTPIPEKAPKKAEKSEKKRKQKATASAPKPKTHTAPPKKRLAVSPEPASRSRTIAAPAVPEPTPEPAPAEVTTPTPVPLAPEPAMAEKPKPAPAQVAAPAPEPIVAPAAPEPPVPGAPAASRIRPGEDEGSRDCPECPFMIMVPAASFVLGAGDPIEDAHRRPVTIAKPFAAGRSEVTYGEWSACVREGACPAHVQAPPEDVQAPVAGVNFGDARRYVQWLATKTGKPYRLPSEAEWEYMARAGTATVFWWGDKAGQGRANCFGCGSVWDGKRAAPVGSFAANPFGLFDTAGNVWEWVEDCHEADAYKTHTGYPAPVPGGGFCDRVLRGGGWDIGPTGIRPTFRFGADPQNRSLFYGFRVVRD